MLSSLLLPLRQKLLSSIFWSHILSLQVRRPALHPLGLLTRPKYLSYEHRPGVGWILIPGLIPRNPPRGPGGGAWPGSPAQGWRWPPWAARSPACPPPAPRRAAPSARSAASCAGRAWTGGPPPASAALHRRQGGIAHDFPGMGWGTLTPRGQHCGPPEGAGEAHTVGGGGVEAPMEGRSPQVWAHHQESWKAEIMAIFAL